MQSHRRESAQRRASPLRGRYLVKNRAWNAWLQVSDAALELFTSRHPAASSPPRSPRRVLLAVGGHLGDAVIATSAFEPLRANVPDLELGILTGSWNRVVFDGHPAVRWIHTVDHWNLDRSGAALALRWWKTRQTSRAALASVRAVGYDAAIDLYAYYPNSAHLLWRAEIPTRIGYSSGGAGPLYTHSVSWTEEPGRHVSQDHLTLLRTLLPTMRDTETRRYVLPDPPASAYTSAMTKVREAGAATDAYVVLHPGAGSARKEWPVANWMTLATKLAERGIAMVVTGAGTAQTVLAQRIAGGVPGVVSVTNRLTWDEFRAVISRARAVVSVDTVAMHLAAAAGIPCVSLMTGMDDPARWSPLGAEVQVLSEPVVCSPCFRSLGCATMSCVRDIAADDVLSALRAPLAEITSG